MLFEKYKKETTLPVDDVGYVDRMIVRHSLFSIKDAMKVNNIGL